MNDITCRPLALSIADALGAEAAACSLRVQREIEDAATSEGAGDLYYGGYWDGGFLHALSRGSLDWLVGDDWNSASAPVSPQSLIYRPGWGARPQVDMLPHLSLLGSQELPLVVREVLWAHPKRKWPTCDDLLEALKLGSQALVDVGAESLPAEEALQELLDECCEDGLLLSRGRGYAPVGYAEAAGSIINILSGLSHHELLPTIQAGLHDDANCCGQPVQPLHDILPQWTSGEVSQARLAYLSSLDKTTINKALKRMEGDLVQRDGKRLVWKSVRRMVLEAVFEAGGGSWVSRHQAATALASHINRSLDDQRGARGSVSQEQVQYLLPSSGGQYVETEESGSGEWPSRPRSFRLTASGLAAIGRCPLCSKAIQDEVAVPLFGDDLAPGLTCCVECGSEDLSRLQDDSRSFGRRLSACKACGGHLWAQPVTVGDLRQRMSERARLDRYGSERSEGERLEWLADAAPVLAALDRTENLLSRQQEAGNPRPDFVAELEKARTDLLALDLMAPRQSERLEDVVQSLCRIAWSKQAVVPVARPSAAAIQHDVKQWVREAHHFTRPESPAVVVVALEDGLPVHTRCRSESTNSSAPSGRRA